ncbi:flagellar biosynthesis protein FlgF [Alphaproteobacteria bacterium]|nr:flagellar biosynthesis protein FlgF [Alphaproteobacteria bacterium]
MDKFIFTAMNTVNNIYDNRSVRAQNMANISVPGYRRDLGTKSAGSAFLNVMNGFQSRAFALKDNNNTFESSPGQLSQTNEEMDIAIRGDGYFMVKGVGDVSLTRRGDLSLDNEGFLVNGTKAKILDAGLNPIQVPANRSITFSENGEIIIEPVGAEAGTRVVVGQIALTSAANVNLKKFPDGEIRAADGAIPLIDQTPRVIQHNVELSNVNITEELVNSIEDQRQYEINIKLISTAQEIDEGTSSLMRLPN